MADAGEEEQHIPYNTRRGENNTIRNSMGSIFSTLVYGDCSSMMEEDLVGCEFGNMEYDITYTEAEENITKRTPIYIPQKQTGRLIKKNRWLDDGIGSGRK